MSVSISCGGVITICQSSLITVTCLLKVVTHSYVSIALFHRTFPEVNLFDIYLDP